MGREIGLCLVYRDMWQSSGKYMPRVDQLVKIAQPIIDMGCFTRVETNGGGFEQINLLYGENPNISNRAWTQPFNDAGIQTQMLERGLNALRMYPVSDDVRKLMFKVKKLQGTDISRSFDGLNDARNLEKSIEYAKAGGMVSQACLCITFSKIHTIEYYIRKAEELINLGAEEICIKDMAGIGRPVSLGKIVAGIKEIKPDILVQYHGHSGPGFSVTSSLEAVRAGADIVDVAMEPLSWGTVHADVLTIHEMLRDAGYSLPDINMKAYMQARTLTQEFMDDFLGYYINPKNRHMNSLLIAPGLPGGMMGSLMSDLENNLKSLNRWLEKNNKPLLSQDDLLIKLFEEVKYVWPIMGYPPLVTPYSQYVKNAALVNVMQMEKGKERWSLLDDSTWSMLLGKSGKLPGDVGDELKALAREQNRDFFDGNPSELVSDVLDDLRSDMGSKGWDTGQDEEELLEYALHPEQYIDFKSGKAKENFKADLAKRRAEAEKPIIEASGFEAGPKSVEVEVNGEKFAVNISYGGEQNTSNATTSTPVTTEETKEILAPLEGKAFLTKDSSETPKNIGDQINEGDIVCYIEAMKVVNAVKADKSGTITAICFKDGDDIYDDDVLVTLN